MTALPVLIALFAGVGGAAALLGVARLTYVPAGRVRKRFDAIVPVAESMLDIEVRRDRRSSAGPLDALLRRGEWKARTRIALERAGLALRPEEWLLLQLVSTLGGGLAGMAGARVIDASGALLVIVPGGVAIGAFLPSLYMRRRAGKRSRDIDAQLVQLCELMASMLSSGFGYIQALGTASERLMPPLSVEVKRMLDAVSLGSDIDQALADMNRRLGSAEFDIIATAITIQRSTGGQLGEILQGVAETIRDRQSLAREVRTLTSQQRFSATLVALLPFALGAVLTVLLPEPFARLFTQPAGRLLLAGAIFMDVLAFLAIRRASRIEY